MSRFSTTSTCGMSRPLKTSHKPLTLNTHHISISISYNICSKSDYLINLINPLWCFFGIIGHIALDKNPGLGCNNLLMRLIWGDILSAWPQWQFHTLPGLLDSRAALSNSYPNAMRAKQGGSLYHFYGCLLYDPGWGLNQRPTTWEADT